jgi:hypothetical protein
MRLPRFMRPVWSLTALGLALTLLTAPMARAADDDDDDSGDNGRQGTVRIYGGDAGSDAQGGYLGVQVQDVTRALQRARNLPTGEGALVSRVEDESPADHSGIRRGDVITEVDREKIDNSQDLIRAVRGLDSGSRVRSTLWRSGSLRTVNVQLGERPEGMPGMGMPNFRIPSGGEHRMPMPPEVNDSDVRQQIRELQDALKELRQEMQSLRREMRRSSDRDDDNDNDRSRGNDRDDDD